jgi:hypothetical protein
VRNGHDSPLEILTSPEDRPFQLDIAMTYVGTLYRLSATLQMP